MDQDIRNKLRNVVTQCRRLLEDSTSKELEGRFGIRAAGKKDEVQIEDESRMKNLSEEDRACRHDLVDHLEHIKARGFKPREALEQLIREIAFTHLNRLCAYKMMEARHIIREAVSRGFKSQGFSFYLADHPNDEKLHNSGKQDIAYWHYLDWLGGTLSEEIGVLFNPNDPTNRIYPPQRVIDEVLGLINDDDLKNIWTGDEAIGWVYQYFTPKELRDKARKESQAPRNSYELAFRNQFYTPRYVVEFLTDNTLGRIWYEMRKGATVLKDHCRYLVRRQTEIFLKEGQVPPKEAEQSNDETSQEELLKQPVYILHRFKKDPRDIKILDPACGSGHFLLYCYDLLQTIYVEAYNDADLGPSLKKDYSTLDILRRDMPGLILRHNLHGIDIDLRATQIAALALWLRCQRSYQELGIKNGERPKITRSNIVCAEPMPGETDLLKEFTATLQPRVLGQLAEVVFEKMKLAGEAGSLLKIEEEIRDTVAVAKRQWLAGPVTVQRSLFGAEEPKHRQQRFDFSGITDDQFFEQAEVKVIDALRHYAEGAENGKTFRRRLFAEDAARGFAFIDLCRNRFDVVLMNPPFGDMIKSTKLYFRNRFPQSETDLYTCFVDRAISDLSHKSAKVGVISNRTFLTLGTHAGFREAVLTHRGKLDLLADLGSNVLDTALVEVAAYVLSANIGGPASDKAIFLPIHVSDAKDQYLQEMVRLDHTGPVVRPLSYFSDLPSNAFAYWLPDALTRHYRKRVRIEGTVVNVRVGLQTSDDNRFARLRWEVDTQNVGMGKYWVFFPKGGEFSPYYDDIHLVVNWNNNGKEIKNFYDEDGHLISVPRNQQWYFKAGLTYPWRTSLGFAPRVLPKGCIFAAQGSALLPVETSKAPKQDLLCVLGALNSSLFQEFISIGVGAVEAAARSYQVGLVQSLPWTSIEPPIKADIINLVVHDILISGYN